MSPILEGATPSPDSGAPPCTSWIDLDYLRECGPCSSAPSGADDLLEESIAVASDLLYNWSGKQFPGLCREVIRPCRVGDGCGCVPFSAPFFWSTLTDPFPQDYFPTACGCTPLSEFELPFRPVVAINEILVDGIVIDPTEYRVDDHHFLVRLPDAEGNSQSWPCCQNLTLDTTEPDTFSIDLEYGREPPISGKFAARAFACEIASYCDPSVADGKCRLPSKVTSVVRQGVSVTRATPAIFARLGRSGPIVTGIWEIDAFLSAHNPNGNTSRGVVLSPDTPDGGRRVGLPSGS